MALSDLFGSGKSKKKAGKLDELLEEELKTQQVQQVSVQQIVPNRFQPRKMFDEDKISELAQTIQTHGLIQPIVLRAYEDEKYEIIAGERRFRAMQMLGWKEVPALIQEMTDKETASVALIENLQREELTAIEEAQAYRGLMELNELTQEALAQRIGKSQSFIANKLRLLKLSEAAQQAVMKKEISERHGRSLLTLNETEQTEMIQEIIQDSLTVKETEALIQKRQDAEANPVKQKPRRKGISRDFRLALNTIKKSVSLAQDTGIKLHAIEEDLEDVYRITIEIPKENNKNG